MDKLGVTGSSPVPPTPARIGGSVKDSVQLAEMPTLCAVPCAKRPRRPISNELQDDDAEDAEEVRADLRSREFAPGLAQESKFDARDYDPSLFRRCSA